VAHIQSIKVIGARQHNLKNINVEIPAEKLVVITGPSGSGKSSLAIHVLYAEGQRRYLESLSSYARQFLEKFDKANVDEIIGLSPTIAIDQKKGIVTPRSTVGTSTEIYDLLRIIFARAGTPYCPKCQVELVGTTKEEVVENIKSKFIGKDILITSPIAEQKKGSFKDVFEKLYTDGFSRVIVDKKLVKLRSGKQSEISLDKNKRHSVEAVIDRIRLTNPDELNARIWQAVEKAIELSDGWLKIYIWNGQTEFDKEDALFSTKLSCPNCKKSYPKLDVKLFSFNSPIGACPRCSGIGSVFTINEEALVDPVKPVRRAIKLLSLPFMWGVGSRFKDALWILGIDADTPWQDLSEEEKNFILYGGNSQYGEFEGIEWHLLRLFNSTESDKIRAEISKYLKENTCPVCKGQRLNEYALSVRLRFEDFEITIGEAVETEIEELLAIFKIHKLPEEKLNILKRAVDELIKRLEFLVEVGAGYLTLNRKISTLSGGEHQRVKLASQLGSNLSGVTYILDEPTVGLHPVDTKRLINVLKKLKNLGNNVIVVEHDEEVIAAADWIVELGPESGEKGGEVVFSGTPNELLTKNTKTAFVLKKTQQLENNMLDEKIFVENKFVSYNNNLLPSSEQRNAQNFEKFLIVKNATLHNLKNITVHFPKNALSVIVGVSGSGKSSLAEEIEKQWGRERDIKLKVVDQSPIGRTPRSNPATYTGIFTYIRQLFAQTKEAKLRGFTQAHFSFNVAAGRCEKCKGEGFIKIDMQFLPDVFVKCPLCHGKRYNSNVLEVKFAGLNIAEVLELTVDEAIKIFESFPQIADKLKLLSDVGLGYLKLGQPSTTLSGGEAQRIKLAKWLQTRNLEGAVFLLDEPTVGLHWFDVEKLIAVLKRLVDKGATVIVIEHNLQLISSADWVLELGPEGGKHGGHLIFEGEMTAFLKANTVTARELRNWFGIKSSVETR